MSGYINPHEDIIQAFVMDEHIFNKISPTFKAKFEAIRDEILGPRDSRTSDAPKYVNRKLTGSIHFERSKHRAHPVNNQGRCYQYQGVSTEKPRAVSSININSKLPRDADHDMAT
jgi:hypothetical protein